MDKRSDPSFDALDLDLAVEIDELCQRFEADWRAGRGPRVDDYLMQVAEAGRKALAAELAALERELRLPSAEPPDPMKAAGAIADAPTLAANPSPTITSPGTSATMAVHLEATMAPIGAVKPSPPVEKAQMVFGRGPAADGDVLPGPIRYFGDYEILREIARGGMGVVFQARQTSLNRPVALKMILAGQLADETDVKRFYTEAESAANLDHPGIVPIFEVGQYQGQHYFSMGFVEGQSLSQRLADGPLQAREAAGLIRRVSEAIEYAHRQGVIHRDLKPANILLDQNGNPRVTDFGLAKKVERESGLTGSGQIMGTPSFMPPEQAGGGRGDVGAAADVYALGATLYCLVTGRPPFQAAAVMDTVLQVISDEPVPPRRLNASVPHDLETICLKCLEKDPARRYPTADALGADLGRYLAGEPILARPVTTWERGVKWARRKPAIAGLAASLALAMVIGFAAVTFQWLRAETARRSADSLRILADDRRREADARRIEADEERREAENRRKEAEAHFALARDAVDNFHTSVSQSRLREIPGLSALRRELLGSARAFYDEFLRRKGDDPGLRFGLAAAQLRVARIGAELDGPHAAEPAYRQALASYEALAREHPDDPTVKAGLADCLRGLALARPNEPSPRSLLERAQQIRAALAQASPEDAERQLALARVEIDLAEEIRRADFPREALGWYERARDIEQDLVRNRPDDHEGLFTLGETLGRMALMLDQVGSPAEASSLRREAIEYVGEARERAPWVHSYGQLLGNLFDAETGTQRALKNSRGALAALEQAVAVRQALARENPDVGGGQTELIASIRSLLEALKSSGRPADVEKMLSQVRTMIDGLTRGSAEDHYQLAAILAGSLPAPQAKGDEGNVKTRLSDESQRNAETAVSGLRKAVAAGFRDVDRLKRDTALAAVRSHEGFQSLITGLERTRAEESRLAIASGPTAGGLAGRQNANAGPNTEGSGIAHRTGKVLQQRILALREETARANPGDPRRQATLARSRVAFGVSQIGLGSFGDAFHSFEQAGAIQETLVREHPRELRFRLDLSPTHLALATTHIRFGRHAAAQRSWRRAIQVLEQADRAAAKDRDGELTRALAEAHLQAGRGYSGLKLWSEAAAEFTTAFQLTEPSDPNHWIHYASLLCIVGDDDAYRRLAARILERYGRSEGSQAWPFGLAVAGALGPGGMGDRARLVAAAARDFNDDPTNCWSLLALAMAELRAGRYQEAVERLECVRQDDRKDERRMAWFARTGMVWPVLAMAYERLGRHDEARRWLDRADSSFDQSVRDDQAGSGGAVFTRTTWSDWAAFVALRREAWGLIRRGLPPDDARERLASGVRRAAMGWNDAARSDLEAVVADPRERDQPQGWIELGRVLAQAGQVDRADAAFARAAALAPGDPQLFLEHGWWIAGPLPTGRELDPVSDVDPSRPIVPAAQGGEPLAWISTRTGYDGWLDFQNAFPISGPIEAAALTWIYAAADRDATLAVDATRRVRIWLNGQLVHDGQGQPGATDLERTAVKIRLRKGRNPLVARISVNFGTIYYLRVFANPGDVDAPTGPSTFLAEADEPAYLAWLDRMRKARYRPTSIQIVEGTGPLRFAALAARNPEDLAWEARIDRGATSLDKSYQDLNRKKGFRVASVSRCSQVGEVVFASIWHKADYLAPGDTYHWYNRELENLKPRIEEQKDRGCGPLAIVGSHSQGATRYSVFGVPLDAEWWWMSPDLEMEPLLEGMGDHLAKGYRPVSLTSYADADRRRFAMVLWRDDPATEFWCIDADPRYFAFLNAQHESHGARPQFLTPKEPARKVYYAGWTRQELPACGEAVPPLAGLETALTDFLRERGIRGATLAVAKDGRVLLSRSFGWSDRNATRPMAPGDPMRLASVGKLFTAAAVQKLIRDGKLKPEGKVVELLEIKAPEGRTIDPRWKKVTIGQLLDHRGGWRLVRDWDPMFATAQIARDLGRPSPASARDVIDYMAGQPLQFEPGADYAYSNFGYCLLGRVIERVTGRPYVDSIRALVLEPLGIKGVEGARSLVKDRNPREPYYVHPGSARDLFSTDPDARVGHHPDGGLAMETLDSVGGLIAPAVDVVRFFSHHGGPDAQPNPPGDEHRVYIGDLPGTFAMALRLPGNVVIVVLCNQSVSVLGSPMFALPKLMERAAAKVRAWPATEVDLR